MLSLIVMIDALERAKGNVGGAASLGRALGITSQAVGQWRRVPATRVLDVERVTGVARSDLRPDLYPPEASTIRPGNYPAGDAAGGVISQPAEAGA